MAMPGVHRILICSVLAQVVSISRAIGCPAYADVANMSNDAVAHFDIAKFPGMWYEVYSHNLPGLTSGCHCTRYNVSIETNGWATDFACRKGGLPASVTALHSDNTFASDPKYPGKLTEAWKLPVGHTPATAYWVLDVGVDASGAYEQSLVYSCTSELVAKQERIYLFSRSPTLAKDDVEEWMSYLKGKGVDTSDVRLVPQDAGCWDVLDFVV
eukprot:CAMPEP_0177204258 /NCGR_PEP_ID=MMETSP0367-20130122/28246_1 /TAXON_ID=447022 ORGANISM="Scrippsiella hangoei-like, Strain SHHI-4" /NCGR_SAMPLE_ID=MMETSP0367 /ASSEMBLY_ACC=CAM_ASM_000362 /LENGTH=212 /DNA_ID=CAMNT_0018652931 /DNA_START=57 /DNA_END=695 /DNA_ORIENTATION=+